MPIALCRIVLEVITGYVGVKSTNASLVQNVPKTIKDYCKTIDVITEEIPLSIKHPS